MPKERYGESGKIGPNSEYGRKLAGERKRPVNNLGKRMGKKDMTKKERGPAVGKLRTPAGLQKSAIKCSERKTAAASPYRKGVYRESKKEKSKVSKGGAYIMTRAFLVKKGYWGGKERQNENFNTGRK